MQQSDHPKTASSPRPAIAPSVLACPSCHGDLLPSEGRLSCARCASAYAVEAGVARMLLADAFEDDELEERWENEERTGEFLAKNYIVPLLERLHLGRDRRTIRLLSIGCGVGVDAEVLNAAGYECYGIDAGNRSKFWSRRPHPERYFIAGAQRMPFKDASFDFAFMNCVLPHIGVVGDTQRLKGDFEEQRWAAVRETIRVVKQGGHIMVANPNRLCPVDLFHRPKDNLHIPRLHGRRERFLQSYRDIRNYFLERGHCESAETLPIENYWGFFLSSKYTAGRVLQAAAKLYFAALSMPRMQFLLRTAFNPWLVTLIRK